MASIEEAKVILSAIGLPKAQQNERSCLTLLALAELGPDTPWKKCNRPMLRTVDMMAWMKDKYGKQYAPNSRETIRRQTIHQFEAARLVNRNPDDPNRPTNSGDTNYQLTDDVARVLKSYGRGRFNSECVAFIKKYGRLSQRYARERDL